MTPSADRGAAHRVRTRLLGGEPLADWPGGVAVLAGCTLALLLLLVVDVYTSEGITFGGLGVVPVALAGFLLSRRMLVMVVTVSIALRVPAVLIQGVDASTAGAQAISYVLVGAIAYVAAEALRASRRNAEHGERLATVVEAANDIAAASLSPLELVQQLLIFSVKTTEADRGTVSRIEGGNMVVEASYAPARPPLPIGSLWPVSSQPLVLEVIAAKHAVQGRASELPGMEKGLAEELAELRHVLTVPLLSEGTVQGLLTLSRFRDPAFSGAEIDSVEQVARIASLALRASRLYATAEDARAVAETAATRLRASERQLAEAQEIAHVGSWEWDIPRNRVAWSEEMYRVYGRRSVDGALTYEDFLSAVHPDDRDGARAIIEDSFRSGKPYEFEHRIVRPDGSVRTLLALGRVVMDEAQRPVLMSGTGQDITERKDAEQRLKALTSEREDQLLEHARRMETLEKLKSEFLLLASHELRGPLSVIAGYLSLMQDGALGELPKAALDVLPTMATKSAAMKNLISEMLQTARLEGGYQLDMKPLNLRDVALEAAGSVKPLLGPEQRLVTEATPAAIPILGDRERLIIIITGLLDNAIKYSPNAGQIFLEVSSDTEYGIVRVRDHGMGISKENLSRLFTRFGRIMTTENAHIPGTGLGLYLGQNLAEMHGGRITVESEQGAGAVFALRLPLVDAASNGRDPHQAGSERQGSSL